MNNNLFLKLINDMNDISNSYKRTTHYYVYIILFDNDNFYIGSRVCTGLPQEDAYMGSFSNLNYHNIDKKKVILKEFDNELDMTYFESELINKNINNPKCINQSATPRTVQPFINHKVSDEGMIRVSELYSKYSIKPSTLHNWRKTLNISTIRIGKNTFIKRQDINVLNEFSNYMKSGYTVEEYKKIKNI